MDNQHRKIAGYRELSPAEVALMNEAKEIEARFNGFIDKLRGTSGIDQRHVSLAQTHGEDAFMRAVRAVAQPARLTSDDAIPNPVVAKPADMDRFIGTKIVDAKPMTRKAWCDLRGWTVPADENPDDAGYMVQYTDKVQPIVEGYDGYVSWSPAGVFEAAYKQVG